MKKKLLLIPAFLLGLTTYAQVEVEQPELPAEEAEEIVEDVIEAISEQLEEGEEAIIGTPVLIKEEVEEVIEYPTATLPAPLTPVPVAPVPEVEEEEFVEEDVYSSPSTSIDDIIKIQQQLTANVSEEKHFESVWSRKGYFNISYNSAKLEPKQDILTGYGTEKVGTFKSDWGVGLQYGRNYNILKKAIANIVMINIDYTPLDLNVNHYKLETPTSAPNGSDNDGKYYLPWNSEKFEYNYGMNVGPSVTLAPFTKINNLRGLHFLKFNVYYHIGYHVSLLQYKIKKDETFPGVTYDAMKDALKLAFGHGLTSAVGFNVSWKAIGVGYEVRWASLKYQSLDTNNFGKGKYKFDAPTSRVFLEIRL